MRALDVARRLAQVRRTSKITTSVQVPRWDGRVSTAGIEWAQPACRKEVPGVAALGGKGRR